MNTYTRPTVRLSRQAGLITLIALLPLLLAACTTPPTGDQTPPTAISIPTTTPSTIATTTTVRQPMAGSDLQATETPRSAFPTQQPTPTDHTNRLTNQTDPRPTYPSVVEPLATRRPTGAVPPPVPPPLTPPPLPSIDTTNGPARLPPPPNGPPVPPPPKNIPQSVGSEILFLRQGTLMAYDTTSQRERTLAPEVQAFAAPPDGRLLALVRETGGSSDIWLIDRNGANLRQMTRDNRIEGDLSWAPDGAKLAYASNGAGEVPAHEWLQWAAWCRSSEVRLLDAASSQQTTLEPGCDPSFSPDGRRVAFATPPESVQEVGQEPSRSAANAENTIRLVNSQGENGWAFAAASTGTPDSGLLVYAPAWSPDGADLAYHRFIGYRALVNINYTEMGGSFEGNGQLVATGAGWLKPPFISPDGSRMAVVEYEQGNARGVTGYEAWRAQVVRLGEAGQVFLPDGTRETIATQSAMLRRVSGAAWAPDSGSLVVQLPAGWDIETPPQDPRYQNQGPGELWRWVPGNSPSERLVSGVDYASPLVWLPALEE